MNVEEFIRELQKLPLNATVWVMGDRSDSWAAPDVIRVRSDHHMGDGEYVHHDAYIAHSMGGGRTRKGWWLRFKERWAS